MNANHANGHLSDAAAKVGAAGQNSTVLRGIFGLPIRELRNKNLNLCVSDKEGGFVFLESGTYGQKFADVIAKNFTPAEDEESKSNKEVVTSLF